MAEDNTLDNKNNINLSRRKFLTTATSIVGAVGAAYVAAPFITSWMPSAKAQAAGAPVEVDLSKMEYGSQLTIEWRGQPIWIVKRSEKMLESLPKLNNALRDPESNQSSQPKYAMNESRSINPEYLVLVGLCTHLGCVPMYRPDLNGLEPGWPGGFFCPCHGSKFDLAGRVYKGVPAPTNLPVPPHRFLADNKNILIIGEDQKAA